MLILSVTESHDPLPALAQLCHRHAIMMPWYDGYSHRSVWHWVCNQTVTSNSVLTLFAVHCSGQPFIVQVWAA